MSKQPLPQMPRWDGPLSHPFYSHVVKRIIDFLFALILLIPGCIIMLPLAIWVKLDSPGPVLYKAVRGGYHNQPFYIYKFRSMYMDAEERKAELMKDNKLGDGKMFKLDFDPRVIGNKILPDGTHKTGIGDFIRRTSLDEFPQFFNVLRGDMSIIGEWDIIGTTRENSSIYAACVA